VLILIAILGAVALARHDDTDRKVARKGRTNEFLLRAGSPALLVSAAECSAVFARRRRFLIKRNLITVFMSIELCSMA